MLKHSTYISSLSLIPLTLSLMLLYKNMMISLEIPLINTLSFNIPMSILMDWISCLFLSTVMFISSMIIMYSIYYIPSKNHKQFNLLLLMFVTSMMILIMSDNIIFILVGWDGLGLSSYMLVIYYQNFASASSGSITLLSNRIGDIMILMSIAIILMNSNWNLNMNKEFNLISLILMLIAMSTKSAQFPFSAWLPAAMAAPTPISALVHSSTLVTAGVFLSIRIMNNLHPTTLLILLISSSLTALYAGMAANWEQDMKKIIALSTLSQIAMMMFAISMKSSLLAFFHLITHALFKSTMFLCAGILIHSSSYQDMRMMGMNFLNSPLTASILGLSSLSLMGIPFLSGFFSKDAIMELLLLNNLYSTLTYMMITSIGMTASYNIRMSLMSFNQIFKSKPYYLFHSLKYANTSITMMAPTSILLGMLIMWTINPEQTFIIPLKLKLMIPLMLLMGLLISIMLSFKNKTFSSMGYSAIFLWFLHHLSSQPMITHSYMMKTTLINDKTWQELYGPQGLFTLSKNSTSNMNNMKTPLLITLLITITILLTINLN